MKYNCDILSLELYSKGRDIDIVEPVLCYLEIRYGLKVVRECIFNFEYEIVKHKPKLVYISNSVGSAYKVNAVKYAAMLGIKTVTMISEGFVRHIDNSEYKDVIEKKRFFFGLNYDMRLYENINLVWNQNNILMAKDILSKAELKKIVVTGASYFDKYKVFNNQFFMGKEKIFDDINLNKFKRIILIAAWAFAPLYGNYYKRNEEQLITLFGGLDKLEQHRLSGLKLNKIYGDLIKAHPDTLFIIKQHPGDLDQDEHDYRYTEYYGLEENENVIFVRPYEKTIQELLAISDLLLAYESTTGLEAWLMGKPCIFVNPMGYDFPRTEFHKGVVIAETFEETEAYINEFYKTGKIANFDKKKANRNTIEREIMTWSDGRNHIRAGDEIFKLLVSSKDKRDVDCDCLWVAKNMVKGVIKKVIGYKSPQNIYDYDERKTIVKQYRKALDLFYKKIGMR